MPSFGDFLRRLHAVKEGEAWSYYWTPDTGEIYTDKAGNRSERKETVWFPAAKPQRWPTRWPGNTFFGVHPSTKKRERYQRAVIKEIAAINCVFAEVDGKDMVQPNAAQLAAALATVEAEDRERLAAGKITRMTPPSVAQRKALLLAKETVFKANIAHYNQLAHDHVMTMTPAPSVIVHSGGGWHLYWFLAETFQLRTDEDRQRAKRLQAGWVTFVGGDDGAKDLARVLRPWGTLNKKAKYAPSFPTVTAHKVDYSIEYSLTELEALLPAPETPTDDAEPRRRPSNATPRQPHTAEAGATATNSPESYNTIWGAYNATVTVTELLQRYGYTPAGDRWLRPAGDSAPSVVVDAGRNTVHTYSSNDPLWSEDSRARSPFDMMKIWEHDGDFKAALVDAARVVGMELALPELAPKAIQLALDWLITADLGSEVADKYKATLADGSTRYSGGHTDKLIAGLILDGMRRAGRAWRYQTSYRQIATTRNSDNIPVMVKTPATVGKALQRLDFMFDVVTEGQKTTVTLRRDFVARLAHDRVIRLNTSKEVPDLIEVFNLITRCADEEATGALVDTFRADDAYQTHTAPAVRKRVRRILRDNDQSGDRIEGLTFAALLKAIPGGLSIFAIPLIAELVNAGGSGCTYADLVTATGAKPSRVAAIVRTLRSFGLVESQAAPFTASVHFIVPDAFKRIHDEVTPSLRTYGAGVTRLDRDLERQANHNERRAKDKELPEEDRQKAERRAQRAKHRRLETFAHLHPTWSKDDVAAYVYAPVPDRTDSKSTRQHAPEMPAPGVLGWNRLVELTGKERLTADEFGQLQALDRALGAGVAGRYGEVVYDRPALY